MVIFMQDSIKLKSNTYKDLINVFSDMSSSYVFDLNSTSLYNKVKNITEINKEPSKSLDYFIQPNSEYIYTFSEKLIPQFSKLEINEYNDSLILFFDTVAKKRGSNEFYALVKNYFNKYKSYLLDSWIVHSITFMNNLLINDIKIDLAILFFSSDDREVTERAKDYVSTWFDENDLQVLFNSIQSDKFNDIEDLIG